MALYRIDDRKKAIQLLSEIPLFNPVLVNRMNEENEKFFAFEEIFSQISGRIEYSLKADGEASIFLIFENDFRPVSVFLSAGWLSLKGLDDLVSQENLASLGIRMKSLEDFC